MLNRNIVVLFISQSLGYSSISFLVLVSTILAINIAPTETLTTLPVTLSIIGTAVAAMPAALLMQRIGRKNGFLLAYIIALIASSLGFFAAQKGSFFLLCACTFLNGCFLAFAHQFRFAAIESLKNPNNAGTVVSFLLFGGVIAAILGPQIAQWGKELLPQAFAGSFLIIAGVYFISMLIFLNFRNPETIATEQHATAARPLTEIARQPVFIVALSSGVISYSIMSFIMNATPVSMHHVDGFDFVAAKYVIQLHIASMFIPSLFNIILFRLISAEKIMIAGAVIYLVMGCIALQGHELIHYSSSLIMLGVGWNFLFVSGTTLLSQSYRPAERFKVQALNDFTIYAAQSVSALSAGWLLFSIGWDSMIKLTLPVSVGMLLLAILYWYGEKKKRNVAIS